MKTLAIALFAFALANATVTIETAGNAEISDFIKNESDRILQVPDTATLTVKFQTAKDEHSRYGIAFFLGEREISLTADYVLNEKIKGTLKADTSLLTGYCGIIECQTSPMPAQQRISTQKLLVSKILEELKSRIYPAFAENKSENKATDQTNGNGNETQTNGDSTSTQ
ncbi:hypothetical protein AGMMS49938_10860 [Fibrobacterales bacterium]|nr:hypothetical protein AGMMS49938_10860 [Fibrobacterales bacterium]